MPKGQYHDALASTNSTIQVAFDLTYLKPIDIITVLWEKKKKKTIKQGLKIYIKTIALELEKVLGTYKI